MKFVVFTPLTTTSFNLSNFIFIHHHEIEHVNSIYQCKESSWISNIDLCVQNFIYAFVYAFILTYLNLRASIC